MLSEIEDEAIEHGWIVVTETATEGLTSRIGESIRTANEELGEGSPGRRVTGVTVGPHQVETQLPPEKPLNWRRTASELLANLNRQGTGLLISVVEIHAVDRTELSELAAVVQYLIREDLPIALTMAGLPKAVSDLLNEGVSTFLRRAERYDLHSASLEEVRQACGKTFPDSGVEIDRTKLDRLAEATGGYPFLIQLVGYHVWKLAARANNNVTDAVLRSGVQRAHRRIGATVLQPAYSSLSEIDQTYLLRMAEDDGSSVDV